MKWKRGSFDIVWTSYPAVWTERHIKRVKGVMCTEEMIGAHREGRLFHITDLPTGARICHAVTRKEAIEEYEIAYRRKVQKKREEKEYEKFIEEFRRLKNGNA